MKNFKLLCAFIISISSLQAQNLSPSVIATGGGVHSNNQMELEWTLGELAVNTIQTSNHIFTEGYHQPTLEVSIFFKNPIVYPAAADYEISVSPNPLKSILNISIQSEKEDALSISLFNLQGEKLLEPQTKSSNENFEMNLSHLSSGIYFLRFINSNGQEVRTFKLNKIN